MYRLWNLVFCVLTTITAVYGVATVVVDCQFNVANQEAQFTVTGTLTGGGTPTTISIYGCPHQATIDASDQATIDFSTQCPNVDWGTNFLLQVQLAPNLFQNGDDLIDVLCAHDTSTLTPFNSVSVSSVATGATTVDYITPTASVSITTDEACTASAGTHVTVGTQLYLCISLGDNYISADGFDGRIVTVEVSSANSATATGGIALTTSGCKDATYGFWEEVVGVSQGKFRVPFTAFMFSDIPAAIDALKFQAFIDVCKYDPANIYCGGYTCGTNKIYRRKREALNETETIGQVEVSTSITVSGGPLSDPDVNNHQDSSPISDDNVCLQKGGFYGLIVFFVLALLATVLACCFLFMKARKSRKYVDERHLYESGSHNPSFRG